MDVWEKERSEQDGIERTGWELRGQDGDVQQKMGAHDDTPSSSLEQSAQGGIERTGWELRGQDGDVQHGIGIARDGDVQHGIGIARDGDVQHGMGAHDDTPFSGLEHDCLVWSSCGSCPASG